MKKISLYIVSFAALALTSCNDWLEEEPKSFDDGTIRTETQAQSRVNRLYRTGAPDQISSTGAYASANYTYNIFLTGYYQSSYEGQELTAKYARELSRQSNTNTVCTAVCNGMWESCFNAINVANTAIAAIDNLTESNNLKVLKGEAKFFRAFNYFMLAKFFGDVPLYTEPTVDISKATQPRESVANIRTQIAKDLTDAIAVLPSGTFASNGHRVTKQMAETMLGDVYFYYGDYNNAKTHFGNVIKSNLFKLVDNTDLAENSYINKLRTTDDTSEAVYAHEYDRSISRTNRRTGNAFSGTMVAHAEALGIYELILAPTENLIKIYPENDLRVQNQQFFMTSADVQVKKNGTRWTWTWDGTTRGNWYYCQESCLYDGVGDKDWNIYRYAEVLLSYAECIAQTGSVTEEAAGYLAQIQARANTEGKTVEELTTALQALSKEKFIEACWTERIKEFPLEYKLWDQCVRTQKYPVINGADNVTYVNLIGAKTASGATVKASDMLWPVPLQEIQRNPNLTQNEGYPKK